MIIWKPLSVGIVWITQYIDVLWFILTLPIKYYWYNLSLWNFMYGRMSSLIFTKTVPFLAKYLTKWHPNVHIYLGCLTLIRTDQPTDKENSTVSYNCPASIRFSWYYAQHVIKFLAKTLKKALSFSRWLVWLGSSVLWYASLNCWQVLGDSFWTHLS